MDAKRTKPNGEPLPPRRSQVLRPFRTVGIVSNDVPASVSTLGQSYLVSTVVGRCVQIYDALSLQLLFMTQPQADQDIECCCTHFHHVFAVAAGQLLVYRRGQLTTQALLPNVSLRQRATKIIVFGEFVCVLVPASGQSAAGVHVFRWTEPSLTFHTTLQPSKLLGNLVDFAHLPTYINKLIIATETCLTLYNVRTGKLVHTFDESPSPIKLVTPCPTALDLVAVACRDGDISLVNVRTAATLFTLMLNEPITALSFRSDSGLESAAMLGIGTANGDVFFYSLDLRRRVQSLRNFSPVAISTLAFLPGQAMALVSGAQNKLTQLVFDPVLQSKSTSAALNQSVQQRARIVRHRGGHSLPPSALLFADADAHFLLSSSLDGSVWAFSLRKDSQSHAFGGLKISNNRQRDRQELPPVSAMAFSAEKSERWATLLTAHKGSSEARTWSASRGALADSRLATLDGTLVSAVSVSACGNFGLVGSAGGSVAAYNLQSNALRFKLAHAHSSAVTGIALLPNNSVVITASLDGTVQFHQFGTAFGAHKTATKLAEVDLHLGAVTDLRFHPGSGLVGVATDSMALVVIDSATYKVVRELWGHGNRITSFDFVPSGRWIISASLDKTIRTWDVPTGAWIDGVRIENVCTHLRISANSEWLATAHVRGVGVQMWSLNTVGVSNLRHIQEEDIVDIDMPTISGANGVSLLEGLTNAEEDSAGDVNNGELSVEINPNAQLPQLQPGLVTLSNQPANKFTTLVHLDAIRLRNRPVEGPKRPEKLPFFLENQQTTPKPEPRASANNNVTTGELQTVSGSYVSPFTQLLANNEMEKLVEHLTTLGPAATDLEIRSLDVDSPYTELVAFINCMTAQLRAGKRFELVQAWMGMLLRIHADVFAEIANNELKTAFDNWLEAQKNTVSHMQELTRFCSGVLAYLRQA